MVAAHHLLIYTDCLGFHIPKAHPVMEIAPLPAVIQPRHLPYHTSETYYIILKGQPRLTGLENIGFTIDHHGFYRCAVPGNWQKIWERTEQLLAASGINENSYYAAVIAAEPALTREDIEAQLRLLAEISARSRALWLGEALLEDRIQCFLQPIVDREGTLFGHEAFARCLMEDGRLIDGLQIITASRVLHIEYRVDRLLHQKAIEAFMASGERGRLFINFLPGFIHRPEVYLDRLAQEVKHYGVTPGDLVLDLTESELQKNIDHLRSIATYCREKGYGIALDDIRLTEQSEKLMRALKPDFIKLEQTLSQQMLAQRADSIVSLAHAMDIRVIGEGVETKAMYEMMLDLGVDLFQGYHIGPPAPASIPPLSAQA
jgi:EAL domain-containing protein (putative c-di-GMP-specific phosphodiesterase class I)